MKLDIGMDQTKFIKRSISEVEETLLIALSLVILIIYLFFRDWIIALRPLLDIPVSLIGAFFIMYLFGNNELCAGPKKSKVVFRQ